MKRDFAALRFTADSNLSDRVYWYLTEFALSQGERVLAPVGVHDRLQEARVEKTLSAEERDAPYDLRLIKKVAAKYGARKLVLDGAELLEFGGVRYDEKHFTPFGRLLLSKSLPADRAEIALCGVTKTLLYAADDPALYREIAHSAGCVLLSGSEGEAAFRNLYAFLRDGRLAAEGVDGDTLSLLKEKLT